MIDFFLQVDGDDSTGLVPVNERLEVPDDILAVARDPGGNYVCVAVDEARSGEVHFWPLDDAAAKPFKIADNLGEFLDSFGERAPPKPAAGPPRTPSLDECREDLKRAQAILRGHEERQRAEDVVVDALLAAATGAADAINGRGGATPHAELLHALRRVGERHAWLRGRRAPSLASAPLHDLAGFRAQDDAVMRAITDHHISEAGAADRIVELLDVLAKARRALLSLGEEADGSRIGSLDLAFNEGRAWLDEVEP